MDIKTALQIIDDFNQAGGWITCCGATGPLPDETIIEIAKDCITLRGCNEEKQRQCAAKKRESNINA